MDKLGKLLLDQPGPLPYSFKGYGLCCFWFPQILWASLGPATLAAGRDSAGYGLI